jgi:putative transcriptional regulator
MSRRSFRQFTAWLSIFLLVPTLFTIALSKTEATPQPASLAGQLLVATPEMGDPNFRHAVILMVRHDKTGALGVVINRPIEEVPLARLMDLLGRRSAGITGQAQVFAGGPVEPQIGFVVHSVEYHRPGTIDIDGRVAMTSNPEALSDICNHKGPRQSLIAFGYAGWGPGQLESEMMIGGWFTVPEDPKFVFDVDRDKLWDEMTKRRTYPL